MQDPRFKETVIIMLYHNQEDGAAGLVVNKPIETMFISELFKNSNLIPPKNMVKKELLTLLFQKMVLPVQQWEQH